MTDDVKKLILTIFDHWDLNLYQIALSSIPRVSDQGRIMILRMGSSTEIATISEKT